MFPELTVVRGEVVYERVGPDSALEKAAADEQEGERFGTAVGENVRTLTHDPDTASAPTGASDDGHADEY